MFTSFIMVATMAVAVPAMMLIVVRLMVAVMMTSMTSMTVMAVMKQRAQRYKCHRRAHDIVTMVCTCRRTG
jgi:hypothetical protein